MVAGAGSHWSGSLAARFADALGTRVAFWRALAWAIAVALVCLVSATGSASVAGGSVEFGPGQSPFPPTHDGRAGLAIGEPARGDVTDRASIAADRKALEALFEATDGDNWIDSSNWMSGASLGSWFGVSTNSNGRVAAIRLPDNRLAGPLPPEIGSISTLEVLDLQGNHLEGPLPVEIGDLARLNYLNLARNLLEGPIPWDSLAGTQLRHLTLSANRFSGPIPAQSGRLQGLRYLSLSKNELSGPIPAQLGNLIELKNLYLGSNRLDGAIPAGIGKLVKLTDFRAQQNRLSGSIPAQLGDLRLLEILYLQENRLSGAIPPLMGELERLTQLRLQRNQLAGQIPRQLGNLVRLHTLLLYENRLSGSIPTQLGALSNLEWFYVKDNRLEGCVPASLKTVKFNDVKGFASCPFGLPGLSVDPGWLDPPFDPAQPRYVLRVGTDTRVVSLNLLAGSQAVAIRDAAGNVLTDADEVRSGFQLVLSKAETDIRIETATQDQTETATYDLAVRWGFPARVTVTDNHYAQAPNNPDLQHNIPDLEVVMDGETLQADFLSHFRRTGGLDRWGYPTSEVLVLEPNALTQFYQRGVVDFHKVGGNWITERRLAWDYVGGGLGSSQDLGVEPGVTNPHPGNPLGPWGHKVSNFAIDGTETGFADFFERLGGVASFGFPKTDARRDTNQPGTLHVPELTPGFVRQYFQSAVLEYHPNNSAAPVQLSLLGDTLRELLVPDWREHPGFAAAGPLANNQEFTATVLWDPTDVAIAPLSRSEQLARVRLAFEKMLGAGTAQFELSGRWSGSTCGDQFYRRSEYRFGAISDGNARVAYFDSGRHRYWYVNREHWSESRGGWRAENAAKVITESGWLHGWTDPLPRIRHALDSGEPDLFEIDELDGSTVFKSTEIPILGEWLFREFEITVDNESNTITGFAWTQRQESRHCFKTVEARNGSYGVDLQVPAAISGGS